MESKPWSGIRLLAFYQSDTTPQSIFKKLNQSHSCCAFPTCNPADNQGYTGEYMRHFTLLSAALLWFVSCAVAQKPATPNCLRQAHNGAVCPASFRVGTADQCDCERP